jgi:hypothetical protein
LRSTRVVVGILALVICAFARGQAAVEETLDAAGIRAVHVRMDAGTVHIVGDDTVTAVMVQRTDDVSVAIVGAELRISGGSDGNPRAVIRLPRDVAVDLHLGAGDAWIAGTYGDIDARVDVGSLIMDQTRGVYAASVGAGDLDASVYLNDSSSFSAENGSVTVAILDAVAHSMTLTAGAGDIALLLPDAYPAFLDAQTEDGIISTEAPIEAEPSAPPASGRGARLLGYLAGGGPIVEIRTTAGDVHLLPLAMDGDAATHVLPVPFAPRGVLVDGVVDAAWLDAPTQQVGPDSEMRVLWSARRLSVLLVSREADWDALSYTTPYPDDPGIDHDDVFELAISHAGRVYRISVNLLGAMLDAEILDDVDDITWDSGASVKTAIHSHSWVVEVGIPHTALGWDVSAGDRIGWNVSRLRPGADAWYDWSVDGGELLLGDTAPEPPTRIPLRVDGESSIPAHGLRRMAGLPTDGAVDPGRLPDIREHVARLDWFETVDVGVEIDEESGGAQTAFLALGAQKAGEVADVRINGASAISREDIERRYRWTPGWHSDASLEARRRLTERAYHTAGYVDATVAVQRAGEHVVVSIDEGFVAGLVVEGIERVPEDEVRELLKHQVGAPYNVATYGAALTRLDATLTGKYRSYKGVTNGGLRKTRGVRLWVVQITEAPPLSVAWAPVLYITRVHGAEVGASAVTHRGAASRSHIVAGFTYLLRTRRRDGVNRRYNYEAAYIRNLDAGRRAQVGVRMSRRTRSHRWQGDKTSFSFSTDFFSSEGPDVLLRAALGKRVTIEGKVGAKEDRSLLRVVSRLRGVGLDALHNRPVTDGSRAYGRLRLTVDARDTQSMGVDNRAFLMVKPSLQVRTGAWLHIEAETGVFEPRSEAVAVKGAGDWPYSFVKIEARAYVSPGARHALAVRFIGQLSPDPLPLQLQPWIGGAHTLRSRATDYLTGDNGYLAQAEWRVTAPGGVLLGPFVDVAQTWYGHGWGASAPETSIGGTLGIALPPEAFRGAPTAPELLRVDVAYPIARGGPFGGADAKKTARLWVRVDLPY